LSRGGHGLKQIFTGNLLRIIKTAARVACRPFLASMRRRKNPRRVCGPGETPPDLAEMILPELDRLIEEGQRLC
jgi:hypothetical protein